jgi:type IV secretion system T-DNA border endonuclease VirD2
VLKAISEQGVRLNIQKATLRQWRAEFARHLRSLGVPANATERAVRGESRKAKKDGIYRASLRGDSTTTRARTEAVAAELLKGDLRVEPGKSTLMATRKEVERGWRATRDILLAQGQPKLAAQVTLFVNQMAPPRTHKELLAAALVESASNRRTNELQPTR